MAISSILSQFEISRVDMTGTYTDLFGNNKNIQSTVTISQFDFKDFADSYIANTLIFEESYFAKSDSLAEKILSIILSPKYRNGSLEIINLPKRGSGFLKKIQSHIDDNSPITFMMPAFPFKIQNPLKSNRKDADLAEAASLMKFYEIHLQIQKIYPPGAIFHIFHDGHMYYSAFNHSLEDADRYLASLNKFIKELGVDSNIIMHDAKEDLDHYFPQWIDEYKKSEEEMRILRKATPENQRVAKIKEASYNNINLSQYSIHTLYRINTLSTDELTLDERKIKVDIQEKSNTCAFDYMALQHTLERIQFFDTMLPNGIRLTVHPKEGHIGIYLVKKKTYLLPWMGVGVIKNDGTITVRYESEVLGNCDYEKIIIQGENSPFYYKQL